MRRALPLRRVCKMMSKMYEIMIMHARVMISRSLLVVKVQSSERMHIEAALEPTARVGGMTRMGEGSRGPGGR